LTCTSEPPISWLRTTSVEPLDRGGIHRHDAVVQRRLERAAGGEGGDPVGVVDRLGRADPPGDERRHHRDDHQ
jgi:hypothetical protein